MRRLALSTVLLISTFAPPAPAADRLDEVRRSFTIDGKPIPPRIFADFGAATLSDSRPIAVTIDALAGMDSNRYLGAIAKSGSWFKRSVKAPETNHDEVESISYGFMGATRNNLLVVLTAYSGGGSGIFYALDIPTPPGQEPWTTTVRATNASI